MQRLDTRTGNFSDLYQNKDLFLNVIDASDGLSFPIAYDTDNRIMALRLGYKHAFIAGSPGSGKSSFLLASILSASLAYSPDDLEIWVYSRYGADYELLGRSHIPHIKKLVLSKEDDLLPQLSIDLYAELQRRKKIFQSSNAYDFKTYRRMKSGKASQPFPRLFVVADEISCVSLYEREGYLRDALRMAHGFGINCLFASQDYEMRPLSNANKAMMRIRIAMRSWDSSAPVHSFLKCDSSIGSPAEIGACVKQLQPGMILTYNGFKESFSEVPTVARCLKVCEEDIDNVGILLSKGLLEQASRVAADFTEMIPSASSVSSVGEYLQGLLNEANKFLPREEFESLRNISEEINLCMAQLKVAEMLAHACSEEIKRLCESHKTVLPPDMGLFSNLK